jgi:hypothetical protein
LFSDVKPESLSITINTTDVADSNELCGTLKSDREQHVEEKSLDDVVIGEYLGSHPSHAALSIINQARTRTFF